MNIIDMARQAGFHFHDAGYGPEVLHTEPHEYSQKCFERFAALVRNATLEEAAGVCDDKHYEWRFGDGEDSASGPKDCAAAIWALKESKT